MKILKRSVCHKINSKQTRYRVGFLKVNLQFHVTKEPQNDLKILKKQFFSTFFADLMTYFDWIV